MFDEKLITGKDGENMFSLGIRKLVVISLVRGIFLLGNIWLVVNWREDAGAIGCARHIRKEYLTGTAITIVIVLLILLMNRQSFGSVSAMPGVRSSCDWPRRVLRRVRE